LATIISTNLSEQELKNRYDDRIYSRIIGSDYQILAFVGDDYRLCR
jgi:DNA replication protein DnaC